MIQSQVSLLKFLITITFNETWSLELGCIPSIRKEWKEFKHYIGYVNFSFFLCLYFWMNHNVGNCKLI